jgi:hypothetical protein
VRELRWFLFVALAMAGVVVMGQELVFGEDSVPVVKGPTPVVEVVDTRTDEQAAYAMRVELAVAGVLDESVEGVGVRVRDMNEARVAKLHAVALAVEIAKYCQPVVR